MMRADHHGPDGGAWHRFERLTRFVRRFWVIVPLWVTVVIKWRNKVDKCHEVGHSGPPWEMSEMMETPKHVPW